jgi:hypothetical protein
MKEFTIKVLNYDGDIYKYRDVSDVEIKDKKLNIEYGEDENATHLMDHLDEVTIKRNR